MMPNQTELNQTLRGLAEERSQELEAQPPPVGRPPDVLDGGDGAPASASGDLHRTLHDLRVHQIELEIQNEELRRAQTALDAARARYFDLYDLAPVGYLTISEQGLILEANLTAATLLGVERGAMITRRITSMILPADQDVYYLHRKQLFETGEPQECDLRMAATEGKPFWGRLTATAAHDEDGAPVCRVVLTDVTERKRAESTQTFLARTSGGGMDEPFFNTLARYLAESLEMDCVCIDRLEGDGLSARTLAVWSDGRFEDNVTYALKDAPCGEAVGQAVYCFPASVCQIFPRDKVLSDLRAESYVGATLWSHTGQPIGLIAVIGRTPLANRSHAEATLRLVSERAAGELERQQAEEERGRLEAQLQQAQKMESVGRLAGGVAHDFNNMLGVIIGHTELALEQVDAALPIHDDLTEIHKAATHSADLTRQLLTFARKQTVTPKVIDLNATVAGMLAILERLIGENIHLAWEPGADLWPVRVDPSQIDQILANLCVNARDAIAGVGTLTIATGNRRVDAAVGTAQAGLEPADYVRLVVSDDGRGMDRETQAHIFEPFFTTKAAGAGTGLGLATVYGAVRQNGGFVEVRSEPHAGTTFTIHLPRHAGRVEPTRAHQAAASADRGRETILLVEDEATILNMTTRMLERQGYVVLAASTPSDAIRLARQHAGHIHLLMTDVVMPEMNGPALARNLLSLYPSLKQLFMSGYTADIVVHHGIVEEGVNFLQKPFSIAAVAAKVREVLDNNQG